MLDPAKLSALTGMDFVQLTTPASGPVEQMTMLRYFMAYHRNIDAVIFSIDERWCGHDQSLPIIMPFPFWLYRGNLEYLGHVLSTRALTFAARRVKMELGLVPADDARGYQDYETGHYRNFNPGPLQPVEPPTVAPLDTPFAGFELLDPVLASAAGDDPRRVPDVAGLSGVARRARPADGRRPAALQGRGRRAGRGAAEHGLPRLFP